MSAGCAGALYRHVYAEVVGTHLPRGAPAHENPFGQSVAAEHVRVHTPGPPPYDVHTPLAHSRPFTRSSVTVQHAPRGFVPRVTFALALQRNGSPGASAHTASDEFAGCAQRKPVPGMLQVVGLPGVHVSAHMSIVPGS